MSTTAFCSLCIFLFYASLIESHVLILREYDEEPLLLDHAESSSVETQPKNAIIRLNSQYKPKKMHHLKKATLQFGRPIYNLDKFERSTDNNLRSRIAELENIKDDSIAYDYIDIKDLIRSKDTPENGLGKFKDLVILSVKPIHVECKEDDCEDRKVFRKYDDHVDWKRGRNQLRYVKRFEIVDNRHKAKKPKYDSSEEYRPKKKKLNKIKKKRQKDSSESEEHGSKKWSRKKKKHNSEDSREIKRKPKKKHVDFSSASLETFTDESASVEDIPKIKKKQKKKQNYGSSEETNRQTIDAPEDYFMQGNKIFYSKDRKKKKRHDFDKRRRLPYFLPKRYHWDPEEIHDLGYYWFNGPKGAYPSPQQL